MSFREKVAWIALAGILLASGLYFGALAVHGATAPHHHFIGLFLAVVILQTVLTTAASIVAAIQSPRDARAPRDERDRNVTRMAAARSYYLLLTGVVLIAILTHFHPDLFTLLNAMLALIMASEALRYALQVVGYRRGA